MENDNRDWKEVRLGDLVEVQSGYAFKAKDFKENGEIPVVKIKNIIPPIIDVTMKDTQCISEELAEEKNKYQLNYNDILISLTGSNVNQFESAVGKIGRVRLKNKKIMLNQRVGRLVLKDESIADYDFIYYYISRDEIRYELASSAGGSANQANISPNQIKDLVVNLPPLPEQKRIAEILSSLDDKIELNNQMNKTLEEMAQAIFKQWFVDFEFPNENGEPYKSSGGEMEESELGLIPKGWRVDTLENTVSLFIDHRGKTPKKMGGDWVEKGIKAISAKHIKNFDMIDEESMNQVSEEMYKKWMQEELEEGDILMTSEAPLGELYFLAEKRKFVLSQRIYGIRAENNVIFPEILYLMFREESIMKDIMGRATGSTVTGIRQSELRKVKILIPENKVQIKIADYIRNILKLKFNNSEEKKMLQKIRDTLLPKLMSGEIPFSS